MNQIGSRRSPSHPPASLPRLTDDLDVRPPMRGSVALMRVFAASLIAAGGLALGCGAFGARVVDLKRGLETVSVGQAGAGSVNSTTTVAAAGFVVRRGRS